MVLQICSGEELTLDLLFLWETCVDQALQETQQWEQEYHRTVFADALTESSKE